MVLVLPRDAERDNFALFLQLPEFDRGQPAGHPARRHAARSALRILRSLRWLWRDAIHPPATQLFGDRMLVANATGCSSIYGANLPSTPSIR